MSNPQPQEHRPLLGDGNHVKHKYARRYPKSLWVYILVFVVATGGLLWEVYLNVRGGGLPKDPDEAAQKVLKYAPVIVRLTLKFIR